MATSARKDSREHRFAADNLSAYLDGEMSARDDARIKAHLARCESCRQDAVTLRMTTRLLRQAPRQPLPRSFVLSSGAVAEQKSYRRWSLAQGWLRTASAIVSVLLVALLSGDVILSQGWLSTRGQTAPQTMMLTSQDVAEAPTDYTGGAAPSAKVVAEVQPMVQAIEMAPAIDTAEPNMAPPPAQAISDGTQATPEAQPVIARAMAEPQAAAESSISEQPVAATIASELPGAKALPQTSSAAPSAMGGGESEPQSEVQTDPEQPKAAARSQEFNAEPVTEDPSLECVAATRAEAPTFAARKSGPTESQSTEQKVVLLIEPEPTPPSPQPQDARLGGPVGGADSDTPSPSDGYTRVWRAVRIGVLLAFGVLLMLIAGLLVAIQKRRV